MPHYRVTVEGTGIKMELEPGKTVRGFFTTRVVSAASPEEGGNEALAVVRRDLANDDKSETLRAAKLSVSEVESVGILARLRGGKKGYTFYVGE